MDTGNLALILSSVTAIAAVIVPAITTAKTIKSNERMKRLELYSPKQFDAVKRMILAYSNLIRQEQFSYLDGNEQSEFLKKVIPPLYKDFCSSCYEVMSLIFNENIHSMILSLLSALDDCPIADSTSDDVFHQITESISKELTGHKSKCKKSIHRKAKTSNAG